MRREQRDRLPQWGVAFDTETALSQPGLAAPPLVCGSIAQVVDGQVKGQLLNKEDTLAMILLLLKDKRYIIVGAHIVYDFLVCAVEWARRGVDILPLIFQAYADERVHDILIGEALGAIADGCLGSDPHTGGDLRDPQTNEPTKYYSLSIVTWLRFGRKDAKVNDRWRKNYWLLVDIPIEQWPQDARDYPVDDVRNTLECCFGQTGHMACLNRHVWAETYNGVVCQLCGGHVEGSTADCWAPRPARNLHQMSVQTETAWAMYLGASWGFDVDQAEVDRVVSAVEKAREAVAPKLIEWGYLKWKKDKGELKLGESKSTIAREVARAYGAHGKCQICNGFGKVVSPSKKMPVRRAWDPEKDGINCVDCSGTGLDLSTAPTLPKTEASDKYPKGQVKADADTLSESGHEKLRVLAEYKADAKTVTNYGPYLRKAKRFLADGSWVGVPLTLWPNVLLETDRTSYADAIQQFPRDGGLRACIRARQGYVLVSCDYNQGEVITHAQSALWILGFSRQAEIVLQGLEPHSMFGSTVLGVDYNDFVKNRKKNKKYANARQAAKPWIFGKPGGMGVVKLVQNQRAQGPDTPCEGGPVLIDDGDGNMVPGYRGLRFCILMDGQTSCGGDDNVTWWGKGNRAKPITPTCRKCLECADRLQKQYFDTFPEASPYFDFVTDVVNQGQPLTDEQCELFGLPQGSQLQPGEMVQHVSNIIRGGVGFNDCANGYFQSLLAVASKMAMRIAQRECCDPTVRVPTDACKGGVVSKFAGRPSPLYGSRCIVLQHDEIIAELLEYNAHAAALRLSEIMVRCLQEVCPEMASACKAPPALMRRWLKAAEPVYVNQMTGQPCKEDDPYALLIPWEPPPPKSTPAGNVAMA